MERASAPPDSSCSAAAQAPVRGAERHGAPGESLAVGHMTKWGGPADEPARAV